MSSGVKTTGQKCKKLIHLAVIYSIASNREILAKFQDLKLSDQYNVVFICELFAEGILYPHQLHTILGNKFGLQSQ